MAGQEFEFVKRRKNWRADRVYLIDASGELVSLPAEWTDVVAPDIFVVVSAGRSPFHIAGLVELADLVEEIAARCCSGVKETSP
ncbi:MAG: Y4bD/Y4pK family protein [Actinomycetota bacterium]|nr:Y4bD/Y4pK family protein [Actinomycetota bacterium]